MIELVSDIMIKDLITISENDTALKAAQLMTEKGISSLIVLSDDQPIGIVTRKRFYKKDLSKRIKTFWCEGRGNDVENQNFCIT